MNLIYKKAGTKDIEILTKTRIQVLKAANSLCEDADLTAVEKESRAYYEHVYPSQLQEKGDRPSYAGSSGNRSQEKRNEPYYIRGHANGQALISNIRLYSYGKRNGAA